MQKQQGYTLLELLVATLLSTVLILGVSTAYVTINDLVKLTKNLENAQEVIRYTSEVFTRSLKQTSVTPTISAGVLTVEQDANTIACDGTRPTSDYSEIYSLANNHLKCDLGTGANTLVTGIETISFSQSEQIVSITVKPLALEGEDGNNNMANSALQIDVALSEIILINALGS